MSYDAKFKGKLVWGSSVYRILLQPDTNRLKNEFRGNLVLYERRHEKDKYQFSNLQEFINILRKVWQESLRSASVQDTRLARWVEEYFTELSVNASYNEILDAIRGQFKEVPPLEVGEAEEMTQEQISSFFPDNEKIMISGTQRYIEGDFKLSEEVEKILQNFLEENKQTRSTSAKTSIKLVMPDGKVQTFEDDREIFESTLEDEVIIESGFRNDYGHPIQTLEFSDIIPYDYEIIDIKVLESNIEEISKERTKEGLKYTWKANGLETGENAKLQYFLHKRLLRTVLLRDDNRLTVLNTFVDIETDDNSIWVESDYIFRSKTPIVENIKILDQLPPGLTLEASKPEAVPPIATVKTINQSTNITWSYSKVPADTEFVVYYDLKQNEKILRDKIFLYHERDDQLTNITRIIKPLKNNHKYGVLIAVKTDVDRTSGVIISDILPSSYEVEKLYVEKGEVIISIEENIKTVKWRLLEPLDKNSTYMAFLTYSGDENYKFDKLAVELENKSIVLEKESDEVLKPDKLILPNQFYEFM